jgi:APA family basic amino acid/polyamine antiporter
MTMKIAAIAGHRGLWNRLYRKAAFGGGRLRARAVHSWNLLKAAGAALTPIAFCYGGWQTSSFMSAELRDPRRDLTRGLLIGVLGVVILYLAMNFVYLGVLGSPMVLAGTTTPASTAMQACRWIAGARR